MKRLQPKLLCLALVAPALLCATSAAAASPRHGRIFVLMVWDGLRPDLDNRSTTPTLAALTREGVDFAHHHAAFPTVTMADGAVIATGAGPGATGIFDNLMYFPSLRRADAAKPSGIGELVDAPIDLEHTPVLSALDQPGAFNGKLVEASSIAREIARAGGYVAIVGKAGPTFLFDDHAREAAGRRRSGLMFVAGDTDSQAPSINDADLPASIVARDAWYTDRVIDKAIPAARAAARRGKQALIVLWQQNPDLAQHVAGLGTAPAIAAMRACDANLTRLRAAVGRAGISRETDLMVVSDHGFATIRMEVALGDMLVTAGLKKSRDSNDIVVARNGGNDLVYLSRQIFAEREARRAMLARIVDFVAAQDWGGPIFAEAGPRAGSSESDPNLGWIPGTFSQKLIGLDSAERSADLVVSFRELGDADNHNLTGSGNPAFALGLGGQVSTRNYSAALVQPVLGVVYADNAGDGFTTGMGMHGAAGERELHSFCAAAGPDFRSHFIDPDPSGNIDVAPTLRAIFGLPPAPKATGRVLSEALDLPRRRPEAPPREQTATAYLVLQDARVVTQLKFTHFAGSNYLDDSSISHAPIEQNVAPSPVPALSAKPTP